jgi:antirestriction protein ArdC
MSKITSKTQVDKKTGKPKVFWFRKISNVVNLDEVKFADGIPKKWVITDEPAENIVPPIEACQEVMDNYFNGKGTPTLRHGGNDAYYMPAKDLVVLPERKQFSESSKYYSVAFHEMGHSTGHESRLKREGITAMNGFGSHKYSKEELVAEFTACFLCHHVGITDTRENSASYLKGWVSMFKDEPKMLYQASQLAKKATEFILTGKVASYK